MINWSYFRSTYTLAHSTQLELSLNLVALVPKAKISTIQAPGSTARRAKLLTRLSRIPSAWSRLLEVALINHLAPANTTQIRVSQRDWALPAVVSVLKKEQRAVSLETRGRSQGLASTLVIMALGVQLSALVHPSATSFRSRTKPPARAFTTMRKETEWALTHPRPLWSSGRRAPTRVARAITQARGNTTPTSIPSGIFPPPQRSARVVEMMVSSKRGRCPGQVPSMCPMTGPTWRKMQALAKAKETSCRATQSPGQAITTLPTLARRSPPLSQWEWRPPRRQAINSPRARAPTSPILHCLRRIWGTSKSEQAKEINKEILSRFPDLANTHWTVNWEAPPTE